MSQPPASVSVPQAPAITSLSGIERIFDAALKSYEKKTKKDLKSHDLFTQLKKCDSPAEILAKFQATQFDDPSSQTESDERLKGWIVPTLHVLCAFSNTLGEGVSFVIIGSFVPPQGKTLMLFGRHSHPPKQSLLAWESCLR